MGRIIGHRIAMCAIAILAASSGFDTLDAQTAKAFEVVSIRPNTSGRGGGGGVVPGGRYSALNQTVLGVIIGAYDVTPDRVDGGPRWIQTDRFDIIAKADGDIRNEDLSPLLRSLLKERFAFRAHEEVRQRSVYELHFDREDRHFGPQLRRAAVDCTDAEAVATARKATPAALVCGGQTGQGRVALHGMSINALAQALAAPAGRVVINRTGLSGSFDIDLQWAPRVETADDISVFTAVREQLGLKLMSATSELRVLVIDNVERPREN